MGIGNLFTHPQCQEQELRTWAHHQQGGEEIKSKVLRAIQQGLKGIEQDEHLPRLKRISIQMGGQQNQSSQQGQVIFHKMINQRISQNQTRARFAPCALKHVHRFSKPATIRMVKLQASCAIPTVAPSVGGLWRLHPVRWSCVVQSSELGGAAIDWVPWDPVVLSQSKGDVFDPVICRCHIVGSSHGEPEKVRLDHCRVFCFLT